MNIGKDLETAYSLPHWECWESGVIEQGNVYDKNIFWGDTIHVHSPNIEIQWQTWVWRPPKFNLVNQWDLLELHTGVWMRNYIQEQKWLKDICVIKAYPSKSDSSQKLRTWIILYSLQADQQVSECLFQASQLMETSSRQQGWLLLLPDSWFSLRVFFAS